VRYEVLMAVNAKIMVFSNASMAKNRLGVGKYGLIPSVWFRLGVGKYELIPSVWFQDFFQRVFTASSSHGNESRNRCR
jgi:hypothetical protein